MEEDGYIGYARRAGHHVNGGEHGVDSHTRPLGLTNQLSEVIPSVYQWTAVVRERLQRLRSLVLHHAGR